jgi:hypothetical protein
LNPVAIGAGAIAQANQIVLGSGQTVIVPGALSANGGVATTTLSTSGAATLNSAAITNNATVGGTLAVTGATTLSSRLDVAGNVTVGTTDAPSDLTVTGATTLNGLTVTGVTTLTGALTVSGGLSATSVDSVNSTLGFVQNADGGVNLATGATLGGTVNSAIVMSSTGAAQLAGDFVIRSNIVEFDPDTGISTFRNGGSLTVTGTTTLSGLLTSNGITNSGNISTTTLSTSGVATLNSAVITNNASVGGNLSVAGDASVGGTLDMTNGQIKNVANGTASGDAVNFGQLQDTRKKLEAGIASTAAMANIPLVDPGKTFALGVGMGSHGGQGAFAVGGSYRFNATTVIRGSIAGGSTGKATAGVGVGISW